jgi:hypothetical protein
MPGAAGRDPDPVRRSVEVDVVLGRADGEAARAYEAAGATDLLLGFADFPATGMLEAFAATVAPALRAEAPAPRADAVEVRGR